MFEKKCAQFPFPCSDLGLLFSQFQALKSDMALKPQQCGAAWGRQVKVGWSAQAQAQNHHYYHQQIQTRVRNTGFENGSRCGRPLNLTQQSAWPPLQVQNQNQQPLHNRPAMGATSAPVAGSGAKRECAGTGVFLPRRYSNPPESRKKSGKNLVLCFLFRLFW